MKRTINVVKEFLEEKVFMYETKNNPGYGVKAHSKNFVVMGIVENIILKDKRDGETYELEYGTPAYEMVYNKVKHGVSILVDVSERLTNANYKLRIVYYPKIDKVIVNAEDNVDDTKINEDACDINRILEWVREVLKDVNNVKLNMKMLDDVVYINLKHPTGELEMRNDNIKIRKNGVKCEFNFGTDFGSYTKILNTLLDTGRYLTEVITEQINFLENNGEKIIDFVNFSKGEYIEFPMHITDKCFGTFIEFRKVEEGVIQIKNLINNREIIVKEYNKDFDRLTYADISVLVPIAVYSRLEKIINEGVCDIKEAVKWVKTVAKDIENAEIEMKSIDGELALNIKYPTKHPTGEMNIYNDVIKFKYGTKSCEFNIIKYIDEYLSIMEITHEIAERYTLKREQ